MRISLAVVALALAFMNPSVEAKGSGQSHGSATTSSHSSTPSSKSYPSTGAHSKAAPGVHRNAHGKIARDPRQTNEFKRQHPCPSTGKSSGSCPGYVIDHVTPLKRGGADAPSNMQWQIKSEAREKDKWE